MSDKAPDLWGVQVKFYGEVMASISHEINNALAIMREGSGLLGDYVAAAERGIALGPRRLGRLADRMSGGVNRASGIVTRMNRFAHSSDQAEAGLDLAETAGFMAGLYQRLAERAGAELTVEPGPAVPMTTRPFLLECAIWRALAWACQAAGQGGKVVVAARAVEGGGELIVNPGPGADPAGCLEAKETARVLSALGAEAGPGPGGALRISVKNLEV